TSTTYISPLSLHDALPIFPGAARAWQRRPPEPSRAQGAPLGWRGRAALALVEDRDVAPHRIDPRRESGRLRGRGGLSVDQPEVVARERERGRHVSQCRGREPDRAVGVPRRALRRGG